MKMKNLRWWVITLIALATVINYIDRSALSVLWPDIVEELFPDESALERKQIYVTGQVQLRVTLTGFQPKSVPWRKGSLIQVPLLAALSPSL